MQNCPRVLLTYLNLARNSIACFFLFGNWRVGKWAQGEMLHSDAIFLWKRKMSSHALGSSVLARVTIACNVLEQCLLNLEMYQSKLKIFKWKIWNPNKLQQYYFCNHCLIIHGAQNSQSCCIKYQLRKAKFIIPISIMFFSVVFYEPVEI